MNQPARQAKSNLPPMASDLLQKGNYSTSLLGRSINRFEGDSKDVAKSTVKYYMYTEEKLITRPKIRMYNKR